MYAVNDVIIDISGEKTASAVMPLHKRFVVVAGRAGNDARPFHLLLWY